MNSNANDRYGSSLERTPGPGKPVDPATRLSELLAQSLEELTRPFDPPKPGPNAARPVQDENAAASEPAPGETGQAHPEESRMDADTALAELEAELFAAAKQVDSESAAHDDETAAHAGEPSDHPVSPHGDEAPEPQPETPPDVARATHDKDAAAPLDIVPPPPLAPSEPAPEIDADAARVIAKVRKLMLVSMAVTVIAVGSVFSFIGYRIYKNEGSAEKKADKLPDASAIPTDVTLALPRGARVVQSAVAGDRLVLTIDIDGKLEVRTFDVKTLQPAGRLNFSATP
jgi:hypothetical protein